MTEKLTFYFAIGVAESLASAAMPDGPAPTTQISALYLTGTSRDKLIVEVMINDSVSTAGPILIYCQDIFPIPICHLAVYLVEYKEFLSITFHLYLTNQIQETDSTF